jgi:hypothetical protein
VILRSDPACGRVWKLESDGAPESLEIVAMASFARGRGFVFNAGSAEWVNGLIHADPFIDQITRNVLDRSIHTEGDRND